MMPSLQILVEGQAHLNHHSTSGPGLGHGSNHNGLSLPPSIDNQVNPPQTWGLATLMCGYVHTWHMSQFKLSYPVILGCMELPCKANSHSFLVSRPVPQWLTFSSKTLPPEWSTTLPNQPYKLGIKCSTLWAYKGSFILQPQHPVSNTSTIRPGCSNQVLPTPLKDLPFPFMHQSAFLYPGKLRWAFLTRLCVSIQPVCMTLECATRHQSL
jgi:hypothetical protein